MIKKIYILFFSLFSTLFCTIDFKDIDLNLLKEALAIPSGGSDTKSYYYLNINGTIFGGERPFEDRWNLIKDKINFKNKRILDIGCNIGLYSIFILKFKEAQSSLGLDKSDNLLSITNCPHILKANQLLQQAFKVKMDILQLDLNKDDYEKIGYSFDIVIAMSIFKWITDKDKFLNFLSKFNEILYEGHDTDEIEIERFKKIGFNNYIILGSTKIGVSYGDNQYRTLIYFSK